MYSRCRFWYIQLYITYIFNVFQTSILINSTVHYIHFQCIPDANSDTFNCTLHTFSMYSRRRFSLIQLYITYIFNVFQTSILINSTVHYIHFQCIPDADSDTFNCSLHTFSMYSRCRFWYIQLYITYIFNVFHTPILIHSTVHYIRFQCIPDADSDTFNCTFERSICGWMQDNDDDYNWMRYEIGRSPNPVQLRQDQTIGRPCKSVYSDVQCKSV
jgi:hypothetical protein